MCDDGPTMGEEALFEMLCNETGDSFRTQYYNRYHVSEIKKAYKNNTLTWTTNDLEKILIQDMKTGHIVNARKYLIRNYDGENMAVPKWVKIFEKELTKRNIPII